MASYDFNKFQWQRSPEDPSYHYRLAGGQEYMEDFSKRFSGDHNHNHNLFLGVTLELGVPTPTDRFLGLAQNAWAAMRRTVPAIAAHTEHRDDGKPLITYRVPKDDDEVASWIKRTVILDTSAVDLDELRFEVGKKPIPSEAGDQTFLYILPVSDTSYGLLLYTSHITFDGAGTKAEMNLYLSKLAEYIVDPSLASKEIGVWGPEADNLLPFVTEILSDNEPRQGPEYQRTFSTVMEYVSKNSPNNWGFKMRNIGPGLARRLSAKFSLQETNGLLETARSLKLTVNHIVHAALFLVCTDDNPPTSETPKDAVLMTYGLVNARNRLRAPYSENNGYPGYCIGTTPIFVPVSLITENADRNQKDQIVIVANALKEKYLEQKAYPSLLAIQPQMIELWINAVMSGPPPPPSSWLGPQYSGDGKGEDNLTPYYTDSSKQRVITIIDFFQSLNMMDPGPVFRSYSWGGRLELSVDFNEYAMPLEVVQGFMDKWAKFIRLVL